MNGWEFLEEYHKLYGNLPKPIVVYVVSSSIDSYDINKSREYKAVTDYIIKPITRNKYQQLLEEAS
jgi:CheY-like chemotaxis protein